MQMSSLEMRSASPANGCEQKERSAGAGQEQERCQRPHPRPQSRSLSWRRRGEPQAPGFAPHLCSHQAPRPRTSGSRSRWPWCPTGHRRPSLPRTRAHSLLPRPPWETRPQPRSKGPEPGPGPTARRHPARQQPLLGLAASLPPTWYQAHTPPPEITLLTPGAPLACAWRPALRHTPAPGPSCRPLLSLSTHVIPFWGHAPQRPRLPYPPPLLSSLLPPLPALLPGHPFARVIYRSKR